MPYPLAKRTTIQREGEGRIIKSQECSWRATGEPKWLKKYLSLKLCFVELHVLEVLGSGITRGEVTCFMVSRECRLER